MNSALDIDDEAQTAKLPVEGVRRSPRAEINVRVGIDIASSFHLAFSENVSEGGLFVATYDTLALGTEVALRFAMPGSEQVLIVEGVVRWVRAQREADDMPPGLGIEFTSVEPETAGLIREYVLARATVARPD